MRLQNLVATQPGLSHKTIVVHGPPRRRRRRRRAQTTTPPGPAALIELARTYAPAAGTAPIRLPYTLLFLSTDGAGDGGLGAAAVRRPRARAAERDRRAQPRRDRRQGPPRLAARRRHAPFARFRPRRDGPARARPRDRLRAAAATARRGSSSTSAFPFSLYEQAPFVARGVPAVTITTARRPAAAAAFGDAPSG